MASRFAIQRCGTYGPCTSHAPLGGLPPHELTCLATHILKQTGSWEHASYAIRPFSYCSYG